LTGLAANLSFFKGTLEKLEIEPQVIRHGKFKSAVEPFINEKMSPENRTQVEKFLNGIWDHVRDEIATGRGISSRELNLITDSLWVDNAEGAMENYIVDELHFKDELLADFRDLIDLEEDEKIPFVSLGKYDSVPKKKDKGKTKGVIRDRIAVIYAQGPIVSGEGAKNEIGSERISRAIRQARLNENVKAIVLRVNSGGGSALASDVIWREMQLARKEKPVVASMGDVAASGGYYISCGADTIVASKSTITGSIGVLGILFNMQGFYKNKLGITFDGVKTNPFADLGALHRPLTDPEKRVIQKEIERIYDVFITHVADGRGLTKEQVDSVGQGRVWAGTDAKQLGLVDVIGGLDRSIDIAGEMAGLEAYRILELPKQKDPIEELLTELVGESHDMLMRHQWGEGYQYMKQLQKIIHMQGIQAVLPYEIDIQ
jgi:protease-4